jgi:hypothetical protein
VLVEFAKTMFYAERPRSPHSPPRGALFPPQRGNRTHTPRRDLTDHRSTAFEHAALLGHAVSAVVLRGFQRVASTAIGDVFK